jgi:hypothetical protein
MTTDRFQEGRFVCKRGLGKGCEREANGGDQGNSHLRFSGDSGANHRPNR